MLFVRHGQLNTQNNLLKSGQSLLAAIIRLWWVWPILASLTTFFLVMYVSMGQSVWFDEGYSILVAKQPVGELIALTGVDAHPPFYYLLLKAWAFVFGWGEYALRGLSAVFLSLTVAAMFLLIRRLFTVRTALATLPFLMLAPFALRYGYEIRMYAMAAFIGVLATLVLVYAQASTRRRLWGIYGVLVALGMFTLYMSAAIWLAHLVWLLVVNRKKGKAILMQPWLWAYGFAVVLFAVYLPTLFFQLTHSVLPGIGSPVTLTKLADIAGMTISFTPEYQLNGIQSLGIIGIVSLVIYLLAVSLRELPRVQKPYLSLLIIMVVVPILFFAVTSLAKPIFVDRYMAHVIIFTYALIGVATALGWRYGKRLASVALVVLSLVMLFAGVMQLQKIGNFVFERQQYPRTTEIRSMISCNDQTVIVADDPYTYIDSRYYYDGCDLRFYSENNVNKMGGYAPLSGSPERLSSSFQVDQPVLYHLHWEGAEPSFKTDDRYRLVQSTTYDKQVVDVYERVN